MMAASSSSSSSRSPQLVSASDTRDYDDLEFTFYWLKKQLREKQNMLQNNLQSRTGKLLSRAGRLLGLDYSRAQKDEATRYDILGSQIELLETDCKFLRTFLAYIPFCYFIKTDDEEVQNFKFLELKIKAVIAEIASELANKMGYLQLYSSKKKLELYQRIEISALETDYISSLQKKVQLLKPGIEETLHHCSINISKIESPSGREYLFHSTMTCVEAICNERGLDVDPDMQQQLHAFRRRLRYFGNFCGDMKLDSQAGINPPLHIIDDFWCHYASVAIRIAHQSCLYWFTNPQLDLEARSAILIGLLDLQQLIDPTTPQFLDLNLRLLRAFSKTSSLLVMGQVRDFLDYVWNGRTDTLVKLQLQEVIAFLINIPEECSEDLESFSTDTKAVLRDLGFFIKSFLGANNWEDLPEFRPVREKVWFLNAEITLQDPIEVVKHWRKVEHFPIRLSEKKYGKRICALSEEMVRKLSSLSSSYRAKKISSHRVRKSIHVLLLKIVIYKVDSFSDEILNGNPSLMPLWSDQNESLKLLIKFINDQREENTDYVEHIYRQIKTAARKVIHLCHSYSTSKITEEMMEKMSLLRSDLLGKIKLEKLKPGDFYPQVQRSSFPETNVLGFTDFLLMNLKELLNYKPDSIAKVNHQIEEIQESLQFLINLLGNIEEKNTHHQELKDLRKSVVEVSYEAEYIIDTIEVGIGENWQHLLWFDVLLEKIRHIKIQAGKSSQHKAYDSELRKFNKFSSHMIPYASAMEMDEVLIDLKDQEEAIIDRLLGGFPQKDVVSIVGMGGIGKTTLAKKIYNDCRVTYHFNTRAWCCVSQSYSKRELLLEILSNTSGAIDTYHQMTDEDLELKLYRLLKQGRYLIVMDDMWSKGPWDDLARVFPDDVNGSRILITSRNHDAAWEINPNNDPHPLRLLTDEESWILLQRKLFHEESCPEELFEVGKRIADNCKGLPLAVVAVAGLLESMEKEQDLWEQIVESLSSRIIDDPHNRCFDILQLSYSHLPENLKACFLYFGGFLEYKDIQVRKLIRLWIAEGFVKQTVNKSLEDLGEDYLCDLISRSLVMVSRKRSIGGVKACCVHDILRQFCQLKSKEEKFLQPIAKDDEPYASFDGLEISLDLDHQCSLESVTYENYRLCFCLERRRFIKATPSGPRTRSLLFFATPDGYPRSTYAIQFICQNFKLLRELDLQSINMGEHFPTGIELLVQLRYLALSGDIDSVPSSIAKLWRLETFVIIGLKDKVLLPNTIWSMAKLRHVQVKRYVVFVMQEDNIGQFSQLSNLLTLSSPILYCGKDTEEMLRRLPNLQKLKCIFFESVPRLDILIRLESLNVLYSGRGLNPEEFNFPENLKKLTLSNFRLSWTHISAIGRLQNLEVLKLLSRAFEGQTWDMNEGEFLNLKFLKLDSLNVANWTAEADHFPKLQQLVLRRCKYLKEVPPSFSYIPTLQMIEVHQCGQSLEDSVKEFEEGIEGLKVSINHSDF